jgi:hypothetical protein
MSGETDDAIFMRLIDMGFRATFTKNLKDVNEECYIFEGDDRLKDFDFQEQHKFALFHILIDHWKEYMKKDLNIDIFIPASIQQRSKEYLQNSNEIFNWFENNYEKCDDDTEIVQIGEIYDKFRHSDVYINYTKAEKRELNKTKFIEKVSKCVFEKALQGKGTTKFS